MTPLKVPTGQGVEAFTPAGQKDPTGQALPEVTPAVAHTVPAAQGLAFDVELPAAVQKPAGQGKHAAAWLVAPAPPVENVPAGQALVVPAVWPARQKWPAGQGACVVLGVVADGQK